MQRSGANMWRDAPMSGGSEPPAQPTSSPGGRRPTGGRRSSPSNNASRKPLGVRSVRRRLLAVDPPAVPWPVPLPNPFPEVQDRRACARPACFGIRLESACLTSGRDFDPRVAEVDGVGFRVDAAFRTDRGSFRADCCRLTVAGLVATGGGGLALADRMRPAFGSISAVTPPSGPDRRRSTSSRRLRSASRRPWAEAFALVRVSIGGDWATPLRWPPSFDRPASSIRWAASAFLRFSADLATPPTIAWRIAIPRKIQMAFPMRGSYPSPCVDASTRRRLAGTGPCSDRMNRVPKIE